MTLARVYLFFHIVLRMASIQFVFTYCIFLPVAQFLVLFEVQQWKGWSVVVLYMT